MKLPNKYGGISKLSGNRRRPYAAKITVETVFDEESMKYRQKQKCIGYYKTRKEALQALADYNHHPYDLDKPQVTFDECFQKITFPESMDRSYKNAYKYLDTVKDKPIRSIKPAELQACIELCTDSQQPLIKTICKRVYNHAIMNEYVENDISQYLTAHSKETQIEREVFTHDEIMELWEYRKQGFWWANVTLILIFTGMRTKELRTMPKESLDVKNAWFDIPFGKNKTSVRGIPLHKDILPVISEYYDKGGNLYNYSHAALNKALNAFHGHRAHDCRHTFTTRMRECGVDHVTIQRLVGHKPSDITYATYTHISPEELKSAIEKLVY